MATAPVKALVLITLTVALSLPARVCAQETAAATQREVDWREDLQSLSAGMKASGYRIAAGIATRGQKDFASLYPNWDSEIDSLNADIPRLPDAEVLLRLMRLMASAHVAHNLVQIPLGMGFVGRMPVSFTWFPDGLAVTMATPQYAEALGARVLSVGGKTPEQFLTDLSPYISHENEIELREQAPNFIPARAVLQHFQMIGDDGKVDLRLEKPGGKLLDLRVPLPIRNAALISVVEGLHLPVPLSRSRPDEYSYYWYQYLTDSKTLYIKYNACANDPKESFGDFAKRMLADADAHPVKRVVIDLRKNGGGNSQVIGPLKSGLASRRQSVGPVYVLIGPTTFSSAVMNAEELRKELGATLVGEPTGGMPDGYGEVGFLTLPHSKLVVQYTTKRWGPKESGGPVTLTPDIAAPLNLADLLAGQDAALDAAINTL